MARHSFRDLSVHPDRRTWLVYSASDPDQEYIYFMESERLVILIKNIYTLWGRKRASDPDQEYIYFMGSETLLPVTYFPTNLYSTLTLCIRL